MWYKVDISKNFCISVRQITRRLITKLLGGWFLSEILQTSTTLKTSKNVKHVKCEMLLRVQV